MTNYKQKAEEYLKACHPDLDEPIMAFADFLDNQTPKIEKLELQDVKGNLIPHTYGLIQDKINEIIDHLT